MLCTCFISNIGGKGVISVISNIAPRKFTNMIYDYFNGNLEEATKVQLESTELIKTLFCKVNPIPVKPALNIMGYNYGVPRLPLVKMSNSNKELLEKVMKEYRLI